MHDKARVRHAPGREPAGGTDPSATPEEERARPAGALPEAEASAETLQAAEARAAEMEDRWLRAAADFENYRKRAARELAAAAQRAGDDALASVIRVVDDLERAVEAGAAEGVTADTLREGLALVLDQVRGELAARGVTALDPLGEEFDPAVHEAVARNPAGPPNRVTRVIGRGYARDGRLLRPSRVEVGG